MSIEEPESAAVQFPTSERVSARRSEGIFCLLCRRPLLAVLIATACLSSSDDVSASAVADTVFERRVVVYVHATTEELDAALASMGEENFQVMADDLMWYRQQALEVIEASGLPRADIQGRRMLHFSVGGVHRPYRFEVVPALDLVILYEPGREPMALPPISLATDPSVLDRFFGGEP